MDVIYSSELVPRDMVAPPARAGDAPLAVARAALSAHGLMLRAVGPNTYVVMRAARPAPVVESDEPLAEVSVYASRYAIDAGLAEPNEISLSDLERIPGSHDDALRALRAVPGFASNASARPYIRGSLSEDVLVRYDGIPLLDPFHLKNFQSLISAIDPAAIGHMEVFSGGFPVQYGTRSAGVIDIAAPSAHPGHAYRASASLISAGASASGTSERLPVDWLAAIRRSTVDLLEPVVDSFGTPEFGDSVGRLRWSTDKGAWTGGWLLLNDRLDLRTDNDEETATARYRDEYLWLARDHRFGDALHTRANMVITAAERDREGSLLRPGVALGELDDNRSFKGIEFANDWTYRPKGNSSYSFGGGFAATRAAYRYVRHSEFAPAIAVAFGRSAVEDLEMVVEPEVVTYSLYVSNRRKWSKLEAELGVRLDAQHYEGAIDGSHLQLSPRLNLRYDLGRRWRLYGSAGRFTQAQHVEEWRVEEAQRLPDPAKVSVHTILGIKYETAAGSHIGLEAYTKRWTTAAPYFDNLFDPFSLLPDLAPDRTRLVPNHSEAVGLELSADAAISDAVTAWGTLAWSRVADQFSADDVLRSWDQPLSLTAGLTWKGRSASVAALVGWHRGWPRTPYELTAGGSSLMLDSRNTGRWDDYYSLDLRGSWTWSYASGDLSAVVDLTNATNTRNECCAVLRMAGEPAMLDGDVDHWLPTIINLGFTYRWRSR